jgi:hypothetical protein
MAEERPNAHARQFFVHKFQYWGDPLFRHMSPNK